MTDSTNVSDMDAVTPMPEYGSHGRFLFRSYEELEAVALLVLQANIKCSSSS